MPKEIARGFHLYNDGTKAIADKLKNGTASASDILGAIGNRAGIWWGIVGEDRYDLDEAKFYASESGYETMAEAYQDAEINRDEYEEEFNDESWREAIVSIALFGECPDWYDPSLNEEGSNEGHKPINTGNQYLPLGTQVTLKEIHYDAGWGWNKVNASGMTITASVDNITSHSQGMIALIPSIYSAQLLEIDGGDEADEIHCTVVYLGEASEIDQTQRDVIIQNVRDLDLKAFDAKVFGHAVFNPGEDSATVYMVGGEEIDIARQWLEIYDKSEYSPYVAHITAGSQLAVDKLSYLGPITFDRIRVAFGDEVTDIFLKGNDMEKESAVIETGYGWEHSTTMADHPLEVDTYIDFPYVGTVILNNIDPEEGGRSYLWTVYENDSWEVASEGVTYGNIEEAYQQVLAVISGLKGIGATSSVKTANSFGATFEAFQGTTWDETSDFLHAKNWFNQHKDETFNKENPAWRSIDSYLEEWKDYRFTRQEAEEIQNGSGVITTRLSSVKVANAIPKEYKDGWDKSSNPKRKDLETEESAYIKKNGNEAGTEWYNGWDAYANDHDYGCGVGGNECSCRLKSSSVKIASQYNVGDFVRVGTGKTRWFITGDNGDETYNLSQEPPKSLAKTKNYIGGRNNRNGVPASQITFVKNFEDWKRDYIAYENESGVAEEYKAYIWASVKTASTKTAWVFNADSGQYISEGERPDFICPECDTKVALVDSVNECSGCASRWHTWSVQSESKTASPVKHFVRTVMKRDNVILAANNKMAYSSEWGDKSDAVNINGIEVRPDEYYTVNGDVCQVEALENESNGSAYIEFKKADGTDLRIDSGDFYSYTIDHADEDEFHFTAGYLSGDSRKEFPAKFTESFRQGYITSLTDQLASIT